MKIRDIITYSVLVGLILFSWVAGPAQYGATIFLTQTTTTLGVFRTNVNTSLTNLNTELAAVSSTVAGIGVAGSNTEIQYNNDGTQAGDNFFIWASSTNRLTIGTSTQSESSALYVLASDAADHVMILRGASSPTAHLFMIEANDGTDLLTVTGTGELDIFHVATANSQLSMGMNTDADGFGGITGLFIAYNAGTISIGDDESAIVVSVNRFDSTGGEIHGLKCLATTGSAETNCISVRSGVNVFEQAVGVFGDMDSANITLGGDVLAAFISTSTNVTLFTSNGDVVIVGDANKFSEIDFVLDIVASGAGVKPTFEFSTSTGQWLEFSPTDGTNGFRNSGGISWELDDIPTWATGTGNEYLIRITRTQVGLTTQPVENIVQISAVTEFKWDKNAIVSMSSLNVSGTSSFGGVAWDLGSDATSDVFYRNSSGDIARLGIGSDGETLTASSTATGGLSWESAGASGANTTLSNLDATTTINSSLVSDTDSTDDLGSASIAWRDLYTDRWFIPNALSQNNISIFGYNEGSTRHSGIEINNTSGYAYLNLKGNGDDSGQILFNNDNKGEVGNIFMFDDDMTIQSDDQIKFVVGSNSIARFDSLNFSPNTDSARDLGTSALFWDETFTDELVLTNVGTGATAANTVRLGGLDLSAGDAGLLITTENDTDHLFASFVGIATTTPQQLLVVGATGAFTITATGDVVMSSSTVGRIIISGDEITDFAGTGLTVVNNILETDIELRQYDACKSWETPIATDDFQSLWRVERAMTISEVWAEAFDGTVTFNLQEDDGSPANILNGSLAPASGEASTSTFADASIAAGSEIDVVIDSITSDPTFLTICIHGALDD